MATIRITSADLCTYRVSDSGGTEQSLSLSLCNRATGDTCTAH